MKPTDLKMSLNCKMNQPSWKHRRVRGTSPSAQEDENKEKPHPLVCLMSNREKEMDFFPSWIFLHERNQLNVKIEKDWGEAALGDCRFQDFFPFPTQKQENNHLNQHKKIAQNRHLKIVSTVTKNSLSLTVEAWWPGKTSCAEPPLKPRLVLG